MAERKEKELEQYLKGLDKKTLIGLYLQKTFDDDYIITDLKNRLAEKEKNQRKEICCEIATECIKHVGLINFGNNHSEFVILASDLNECLNEVIKRR